MAEISEKRQKIIELLAERNDDELVQMVDNMNLFMSYYRCAMLEIETKFRVLDEQFSLQHERNPIESIKSRLKSVSSIREKLERKNLPMTAKTVEENLYDVAGLRVICSFPEDVYLLADSLLKQDDITLIRRKDYIQNPKPNGYRSLHLIVEIPIFLHDRKRLMKVEVQLRTIAMDWWASSEHKIRYKKKLSESMICSLLGRQEK